MSFGLTAEVDLKPGQMLFYESAKCTHTSDTECTACTGCDDTYWITDLCDPGKTRQMKQ